MWNKVSDKLPEELESTLCLNEFGGMWVDQFNNGSWCDEQPIYWMPLPAPPTAEKQGAGENFSQQTIAGSEASPKC